MTAVLSFFRFQGKTRRADYAFASLILLLVQYALVAVISARLGQPLHADWRFFAMPLRALAPMKEFPAAAEPIALALVLIFAWAFGALAFRRANDAGVNGFIAALAMTPVIQVPAIVFLSVAPSRAGEEAQAATEQSRFTWRIAAQGVLAGIGLTMFAVAIGALVFGSYGVGMFVVSPLVIGAVTAFLANRTGDIGAKRTFLLVTLALALGGIALVVVALEGVVCIVLASPLALLAALIGGLLGRAIARAGTRSARPSLMSVAFLPLVFASESALPANTYFETRETIEVRAPAHAVWLSIVHMEPIVAPPALPFRLGVAYPISGEIVGSGVGALRRGRFSTGVAIERVTAWRADRELAFVVLSDPPAMHELSPYAHVNAPHVKGYFKTIETRFEIVPEGPDRCRILEQTTHELRLDPILYWMPFARWIIHENNMRVLSHIAAQAERHGLAVGMATR